jgi:preprotein translocase subunit SecF
MFALRILMSRFYRGEANVDFVGRPKLWYTLSGLLLGASIAGLLLNGLNFGVEFRGGAVFNFRAPTASVEQVRDTVEEASGGQVIVQQAGQTGWRAITHELEPREATQVQQAIAKEYGLSEDQVNTQVIGPTWGGQISQKALIGLLVFLVAIVLYLSIAFEWRMAFAASIALIHDLVITGGIYAWSGFEVTPATVLGFLTILGYSLYDAVVVFDMIKEVTARISGGAKMTYSQAANQALNQTLVRSLNTSLVALLPVASILFIGTTLLGAGTLKDLSLVLFVGMLVGTYSSLCIATPVLVDLKERQPQYKALARRVAAREKAAKEPAAKGATKGAVKGRTRVKAATGDGAGGADGGADAGGTGSGVKAAGKGGTRVPKARPDDAAQDASADDEDRRPVGAGSQRRAVQRGGRQQPRKSSKRHPGKKRKR